MAIQRGIKHIGFVSRSAEQTRQFGRLLGEALVPGDLLLLEGPFGAGKTTFVQGLAAGAEAFGRVTSPSFTLVNEYRGRVPIFHVDLFRLKVLDLEIEQALEDYEGGEGVTVVEWPRLLPDDLRMSGLRIDLQVLGDTDRSLIIHSEGTRWNPAVLAAMIEETLLSPSEEDRGQ